MTLQCNLREVLRELEIRTAHALAEVERARQYLQANPDPRTRHQFEAEILSNSAVVAELQDLQSLITGQEPGADQAPMPAERTRPHCWRGFLREAGARHNKTLPPIRVFR